ncbi:MAG: PorP/SprF family type IX secretion system membrane protein [Bacteroidaceae bacterium]|nr:PorP/SprF family type IX secretion system membrane protein [Prevotella sp.]MBR1755632.1 PorP/SprF family type IX secretion system membrane protein [Bacteroidaceae bacterium]
MRRIPIVALLALAALAARAQYDVSFGHYWAMEPSFNPAAIGKEAKLNAAAAYALQMAGFEHNPNTMYVGADMPFYALKSYHGAGIQFINDNIGLFSHKRFGVQYAYQPQLMGGKLSLGVQLSMLSENFDGSKLELEDASDPAFTSSSVNGTGFDISLGVYYKHRDWYAGLSVLHLNAPTVELGEKNELAVASTYYLTGGYNIRLKNPFLTIQTSVLGRTDGVAWRGDISGRLLYTHEKRVMYAGLSYSPTNSVTVQIGGDIRGIRVGYSYEIYTSAISIGNGSHELFVGYQTEVNLYKKGRNLHKSVRYL